MPKPIEKQKKPAKPTSPLREMVGDEVYEVWLKMLKALVPSGRTHRLSVVAASMLAYASSIASRRGDVDDEDDSAFPLLAAQDGMDDAEASDMLAPMLIQMFKDAGVKRERVSRRGDGYSIVEEAVIHFCRWDNYEWEG